MAKNVDSVAKEIGKEIADMAIAHTERAAANALELAARLVDELAKIDGMTPSECASAIRALAVNIARQGGR